MAEPRDAEFLIAFAEQRYKNADKAIAFFKRIAANSVEFHSGHPQLVELLMAGQGSVCITCYTHHVLPRMQKGAPLNYLRSLGVGLISATAVFKNAPHPNAAWLFHRWAASDEGQKAFGIEGRIPANPKVEPAEPIGLETVYGLGEKGIPGICQVRKDLEADLQLEIGLAALSPFARAIALLRYY